MFLVLPLTFLGLAVNGEKVVHTSWDSTSEWDFQKSSYSKISTKHKKKNNNNNYYIYIIIK